MSNRRALHEALPNVTMNDRTYDVLKWWVTIILPALGTFYFAVAAIWGLPYAEEIVGTIVAVTTLLGVILGVSNAQYKSDDSNFDGILHLDQRNESADYWTFEATKGLEEIEKKNQVSFKVSKP